MLDENEIEFVFTKSSGPGGQNINKVASAVQLRINIQQSASLQEPIRTRLLTALANRLTAQGELIIKAKRHRTQERNKQDALERLCTIIRTAAKPPVTRHKTKPTLGSKQRRLSQKKQDAKTKVLRKRVISKDD